MRRLLTDLCVSAAFLADLFRTTLVETVRTARTSPAAGPIEPLDAAGPGQRVRGPFEPHHDRRNPSGGYWFR